MQNAAMGTQSGPYNWLASYTVPFTQQKVYNCIERQEPFTWKELKILYRSYFYRGKIPSGTREKDPVIMIHIIVSCEAQGISHEKLLQKIEAHSKWNEFTRMLLKSISEGMKDNAKGKKETQDQSNSS